MKYNVTDIEFDLDDDYDMTEEDKVKFNHQLELELHDLARGVWEADDEDDLIEEITSAAGWCIKSIDYDIQLNLPTRLISHYLDSRLTYQQ